MGKFLLSKSGVTKIQAIIVAVIIIVALAAGVGYWYVTKPKEGPESIILGADAGFTGPLSTLNVEFKNGWDLVISEYNEEGGVYVSELGRKVPIELKYIEDNKGDATSAVSNVEKLCTTYNVDFILGGCGTSVIRASAPVADRNKKIYINAGTAYLPLHQEGYKYVFTVFASSRGLTKPLMEFIRDAPLDPEPKVLAHWHDDGSLAKEIAKWANFLCPIEYTEKEFPMGTTDFTAAIAEAKEADPPIDVLLMTFQLFTDQTTLWRQLEELDWAPKLTMLNVGPSSPVIVETLGESVYDRLYYLDPPQTQEVYAIYDKIIKKYSPTYTPGSFTYWSYTALKSLLLAIEDAGSLDTDKVADALYALKWKSPIFEIDFASEEYVGYADVDEPVVKFVPTYTIHENWTYVNKPVWPTTAGVPGWEVVDYVYPIPGWD